MQNIYNKLEIISHEIDRDKFMMIGPLDHQVRQINENFSKLRKCLLDPSQLIEQQLRHDIKSNWRFDVNN